MENVSEKAVEKPSDKSAELRRKILDEFAEFPCEICSENLANKLLEDLAVIPGKSGEILVAAALKTADEFFSERAKILQKISREILEQPSKIRPETVIKLRKNAPLTW